MEFPFNIITGWKTSTEIPLSQQQKFHKIVTGALNSKRKGE